MRWACGLGEKPGFRDGCLCESEIYNGLLYEDVWGTTGHVSFLGREKATGVA